MKVNKHEKLKEWVESFLEDNYLYYESTMPYPNVRLIVPNYGDYLVKTDILGFKYKSYSFVFIGYEQLDVGTSDVNLTNMQLMDSFTEWLEEQRRNENFPDFGENCSDYDIVPLQNMANLASIDSDYLAKYMLGVRIDYKEYDDED
jgi:hypothetical protein